jgi:hypothetical protein
MFVYFMLKFFFHVGYRIKVCLKNFKQTVRKKQKLYVWLGDVAKWSSRLPTEQKIPDSNPARV